MRPACIATGARHRTGRSSGARPGRSRPGRTVCAPPAQWPSCAIARVAECNSAQDLRVAVGYARYSGRGGLVRSAIGDVLDPGLAGAVRAAEVLAARLDAVTDDRHLAMQATRREHLDRALERVED